MSYGLYETFDIRDIPKRKITLKQKRSIIEKLSSLEDENKKAATLMLICEHARRQEDYQYTLDIKLPYDGHIENENVVFDAEKFPNELLCILQKFISVVLKE